MSRFPERVAGQVDKEIVDRTLWHKFRDPPGGAAFYNVKPMEQDANVGEACSVFSALNA